MAGNTQKFNSLRRQRELERSWDEMSSLGKIYVSSEVILYSIEDIRLMSGWSETTVQKLFNDPKFPAIDYGKRKLVENHALMQYFSIRREKARDTYWR
ncbi:MAG: hypothetical protein IKK28_12505 [Mogibacterium sp.]|jgi:hypothetical protein|nr:hypothetical protein [Mogibacterium sp.]MBQ1744091.1 hypothetical protein [Clostridiales bacterium]MBR2671745.1 hypothetical protein [Oscillospiraceae bacterium]MBQ6439164.1 hypothetical protein [Mogibacterium sp.]MBR3201850.1 hypothetical protein [Mogibacterium sp.]